MSAAPMRRVLLCLADPVQAKALAERLDAEGYDSVAAAPSELAERAASPPGAPPFVAVVLDGDVPALREFDFLKQLRARPELRQTLFVYCHRRVDIGYVLRAMDAGAGVFLFTPIEADRLLRHLRERVA